MCKTLDRSVLRACTYSATNDSYALRPCSSTVRDLTVASARGCCAGLTAHDAWLRRSGAVDVALRAHLAQDLAAARFTVVCAAGVRIAIRGAAAATAVVVTLAAVVTVDRAAPYGAIGDAFAAETLELGAAAAADVVANLAHHALAGSTARARSGVTSSSCGTSSSSAGAGLRARLGCAAARSSRIGSDIRGLTARQQQ